MCATIEDRAHYRRVKVQVLYNLPWYCDECSRSNWFLGIVRNTVEVDGKDGADGEEEADGEEGVDGDEEAGGEEEADGEEGADGEEEADGEEGADGEEEADGEEGADADKETDGQEINGDRTDDDNQKMDNDSIDVQDPSVSYANRTGHDESSLIDPVDTDVSLGNQKLTWHIINGATKRGGAHLVNSLGYTYVMHKQSKDGDAQYWVCARKTSGCKARVVQRQDSFTCGWKNHICHPSAGAIELATVRATARNNAKTHQFISAQEIVNKVYYRHYT